MTSEAVKVIVRCRPLNQREKELRCQNIVSIDSSCGQCSLVNPNEKFASQKAFCFDGAYYTDSTTEQIYNEIVFPIVECVTEGYNGTVFAYGQTGCGKSFTMQGTSDPVHRGIIPRSFEHIFEAISTTDNAKFLVQASYLEIYNEEIRDLLAGTTKKKYELKESGDSGVYVSNLSMHIVNDVYACEKIMEEGWKNRSVGATQMNADSSRSHSIFTIYIERIQTDDLETNNVKSGKLNLVDLAGSERQAKTGASGDRLKEATKINLSLSALGNVISALVDGKSKHIPFRDSKLTRLLQDSLGGNTKTLMVSCISPADNNYDETLSTLRYANRAKNIKNKPKINEDPNEALLREYREEILQLKKLIQEQVYNVDMADGNQMADKNVIEKIKQDYDMEIKNLLQKYEEEVKNKEKLKEDINKLKSLYENDTAASVNKNDSNENSVLQAMEKLQAIEGQMVGGEKANDIELKEKRARKKKIAETKLNATSEAVSKLNDDDKMLLKAYGDITEELRAKSLLLKKTKRKIQSLEQEVRDLQSEFETERTDYLEAIRRQDHQLKLQAQILDKIQPFLKSKCNYSNIDQIKSESVWDDNSEQWILPELTLNRIRLPPAQQPDQSTGRREMAPSNLYKPDSPTSIFDSDIIDQQANDINGYEDRLLRKMENSDNEEIVSKYFMPKRRDQLLNNLHKLKLSVPVDEQTYTDSNGGLDSRNTVHMLSTISNKINQRSQARFNELCHINGSNTTSTVKHNKTTTTNNNSNNYVISNHTHHKFEHGATAQSAETPRKLLPLKRMAIIQVNNET